MNKKNQAMAITNSKLQDDLALLENDNKISKITHANVVHDLKKVIKIKNMQLGLMKKNIAEERRRMKLILRNKKGKIAELNQSLDNFDHIGEYPEFNHDFLSHLIKNDHVLSKQGRRYSEKTLDICYVLYSYSPVTYSILQNLLPLPSDRHLRECYRDTVNLRMHNLLNKDQLNYLLDNLRESCSMDDSTTPSVIAFDATVTNPMKTNVGAIFLYTIQPLHGDRKSFPIHVIKNENGHATDDIVEIVDELAKMSNDSHFHCRYVASDGELKTNRLHERFAKYIQNSQIQKFKELIEHTNDYPHLIPISDWIHILKNMRSRLINQDVKITEDLATINLLDACELLNLPDVVHKEGASYAMRDDLALILFNPSVMKSMLSKNMWAMFCFVFPFTLVTITIQSPALSIGARNQLLELAYHALNIISRASTRYKERPSQHSEPASYLTKIQSIRIQNTILAIGHALMYYSDGLTINRLGTQIIEYMFARMRRMAHGQQSDDKLMSAFVKSEISKEICAKYDLNDHVIGRVNYENRTTSTKNWDIDLYASFKMTKIREQLEMILAVRPQGSRTLLKKITNIIQLCEFVEKDSGLPQTTICGELTGKLSVMRNISFGKS